MDKFFDMVNEKPRASTFLDYEYNQISGNIDQNGNSGSFGPFRNR